MASLYFFNFNNYYNRIVKGHEFSTAEDFITAANGYSYLESDTNLSFNPNDNITTVVTVGRQNNPYSVNCDYCIYCENNTDITSRWFVLEQQRNMQGQWKLDLLRDVVADYYNEIIDADCFIQRATVDNTNPLIFNKEDVKFNQIKWGEYKLYDKTETPWIVGYLAQTDGTNPIQFGNYSIVYNSESDYPDYNLIKQYLSTPNKKTLDQFKIHFQTLTGETTGGYLTKKYYHRFYTSDYDSKTSYGSKLTGGGLSFVQLDKNVISIDGFKDSLDTLFTSAWRQANKATINGNLGLSTNDLSQYKDRVCYDSDTGKYYKIYINEEQKEHTINIGNSTYSSNATRQLIKNGLQTIDGVTVITESSFSQNADVLQVTGKYMEQYLRFEEVSVPDAYSIDLRSSSTARLPDDAPYYTFAMPYTEANYMLAIEMGTKLNAFCYDIQLLPYCPVQQWYNDVTPNLTGLTEHVDYDIIYQGSGGDEAPVSYLFWIPKTTFTFDIPFSVEIEDYKVDNECNMYRLCSPNGNGEYEFSLAMNGGMNKFNVDCTYRPVNPYIHMNPDFNRLYGKDFNDFRGLICQGDFSIPAISDKWVEYEMTNKNYQNIFNRDIRHQERLYKIQHQTSAIGALASALGLGAMTGNVAGQAGGLGAGLGVGAAAGGLSLGAGIADLIYARKAHKENISYARDVHEMQLDSIQALPNSIVKTGCKTNNNKLVPYLEYWTCTATEKEAFRKKLYFEGMTIGAYGKIKDYLQGDLSFVQAELKRSLAIQDDTHLFGQINQELQKGVYIK